MLPKKIQRLRFIIGLEYRLDPQLLPAYTLMNSLHDKTTIIYDQRFHLYPPLPERLPGRF